MELKDLVKNNNQVKFSRIENNKMFYNVEFENVVYQFSVPMDKEEIGLAEFNKTDKATLFMRYIRKAIEKNELLIVEKEKETPEYSDYGLFSHFKEDLAYYLIKKDDKIFSFSIKTGDYPKQSFGLELTAIQSIEHAEKAIESNSFFLYKELV